MRVSVQVESWIAPKKGLIINISVTNYLLSYPPAMYFTTCLLLNLLNSEFTRCFTFSQYKSSQMLHICTKKIQGCRGYGDSHRYGDSHGYRYGMGMGTVMNPHGPVGILWEFLNGFEIKRTCAKRAINIVVVFIIGNQLFKVLISWNCWFPRIYLLPVCSLCAWLLTLSNSLNFFRIIY